MTNLSLERETENILIGMSELLCNDAPIHPGTLLTDGEQPAYKTISRLAERWTVYLNTKGA